ncbi:MAG: hypothetical protein NZ583_07170 [Desulfobacterota bacterium]|nr:hypothetical protein [Thermodesulfobacteriota bacterium]MDW8002141.1 MnhB domain-containing protein [Deltaproteobacteria bacterium]
MLERDEDIILKTTARILSPLIQLMGLYVYAHGHISPGGGFQGGCIFAASFILMAIVLGVDEVIKRIKYRLFLVTVGFGAFLYAFLGLISVPIGGEFLNYAYLKKIFMSCEVMARYYAIAVVELGVQITVTGSMFAIFYYLAAKGNSRGSNSF